MMVAAVEIAGTAANIADGIEAIEKILQCLMRIMGGIRMRMAVVVVTIFRRMCLVLIIGIFLFNAVTWQHNI